MAPVPKTRPTKQPRLGEADDSKEEKPKPEPDTHHMALPDQSPQPTKQLPLVNAEDEPAGRTPYSRNLRMSFWGVEVKPKKPYILRVEDFRGRIHITHATLGSGLETEKSTLQCHVGKKAPIYLCTLFPGKTESCPLHLEFEDDNVVTFSVIGPRSVHLSGFFLKSDDDHSDYSSEEVSEFDTEDLYEHDREYGYEDSFVDDRCLDKFHTIHNNGVVIEEIFDEEEVAATNVLHRGISGNVELFESDSDISEHETPAKKEMDSNNMESEDEDGFPISPTHEIKPEIESCIGEERSRTNAKKKRARQYDDVPIKATLSSEDGKTGHELDRMKKIKKTKRLKAEVPDVCFVKTCDNIKLNKIQNNHTPLEDDKRNETVVNDRSPSSVNIDVTDSKKVKKKKKSKKKATETSSDLVGNGITEVKSDCVASPSQTRTFGNGLVVEVLYLGKANEKKASPGKKIGVRYTGKLKKNGQIFDSNVGKAPFKFILGVNQVIKGWDIGVSGMRIGDKRRLTIPPEMGYGNKKVGPIPAGSWLIFDVELVEVR